MPKFTELSVSNSAFKQTYSVAAGLRPLLAYSLRKTEKPASLPPIFVILSKYNKSFIDEVNGGIT